MKVFWSWQSDTPGKTGRHFIRQVLSDAIATLKEPEEVEEPSERDAKDALHLDHDRLGVSGSPRLLETILKKIDASAVFVGDVTPVSVIPGTKTRGNVRREKRNMNPNVAIELGYAFKTVTEQNVLMVLNTYYGGREFLPFDIAGNAGPLMFNLPPNANASRLKAEAASLKGQLITALRAFIKPAAAPSPTFVATPHRSTRAVFFDLGEVLASFGEERDRENYSFDTDKGCYMRIAPRTLRPKPFSKVELNQAAGGLLFDSFSNDGSGLVTINKYGMTAVEPLSRAQGTLASCTQLFQNGEIWSFAPWIMRDRGLGKLIPQGGLERVVRRAIPRLLQIEAALGLQPPYQLELGAVGIAGFQIAVDNLPDTNLGPIYDDEFSEQVILNAVDEASLVSALVRLFQASCEISGYPRPPTINGFPPN